MTSALPAVAPRLSDEERAVKEYLLRAIAEPDEGEATEPARSDLVRRFATNTPELFCSATLSILLVSGEREGGSPTLRSLVGLVLKQHAALFLVLLDPFRFTKQQAIALVLQLLAADPSLDVRLGNFLVSLPASPHIKGFPWQFAERALDVLEHVSHGRRIIPTLTALADHPEPRVASKSALLLGKRFRSPAWAIRQIRCSDNARQRAEAIESIWGLDMPACSQILWECTQDSNHRVAGSAWFGLHLLNDPKVHSELLSTAQHTRPEFRSGAAWAMAKIGDGRYMETLNLLMKDENTEVRGTVIRALLLHSRKASE